MHKCIQVCTCTHVCMCTLTQAHAHTQGHVCTHVCVALSMSLCPARLELLEHTYMCVDILLSKAIPDISQTYSAEAEWQRCSGNYVPGPIYLKPLNFSTWWCNILIPWIRMSILPVWWPWPLPPLWILTPALFTFSPSASQTAHPPSCSSAAIHTQCHLVVFVAFPTTR